MNELLAVGELQPADFIGTSGAVDVDRGDRQHRLYVTASCYYDGVGAGTPVPLLDQFGAFTTTGVPGCFDDAHIVAVHPALAGLTDAILSNWGCSVHEAFDAFPAAFIPLAIAENVGGPGSINFADGSFGIPYILARGVSPVNCGDTVVQPPEECDDGNIVGGDGCSALCTIEVCGNDFQDVGEQCDGTDDAACPGQCAPAGGANECTCPGASVCGNDVVDAPEQCDGTDDAMCPGLCHPPGHPNECGCPAHYQCYESARQPRYAGLTGLMLADQFGDADTTLRRRKRFCNPADKNDEDPTAIADPEHLTGYTLRHAGKFERVDDVRVINQFGDITVQVRRPELLLVPSAKDLGAPIPPLVGSAVDHFQCYRVKRARQRVSGVKVVDQFGEMTVDVKKPTWLCAPVDKNNEGILDPTVHMMCYGIRARPVRQYSGIPFWISNQLEETVTSITRPTELCVPSVKVVCEPGTLFGTDASNGNLITVDRATGTAAVVGPIDGGRSFPALAVDPVSGIMYGGTGGGGPDLYSIDTLLGTGTFVGNTGLGFAGIGALEFRDDGTLFASVNIAGDGGTGSDHLATIDPVAGTATVIGPYGACMGVVVPTVGGGSCDIEGMEALAFDSAGTLWGALSARGAAGSPGLYTIDPASGAATFQAPILDGGGNPPSGGVVSLRFACDGTLYGGTAREIGGAGDGGRLVTIDPGTGLFSFVGAVSATGGPSLGALAETVP